MQFRANSWLLNWTCLTLHRVGTWGKILSLFENDHAVMTEVIEHEICLLTWVLSRIGHINNTDRSSEWMSKWIYIAQVPLDNALVLGNLSEYRHITKTRFFGQHYCCMQYRCIFYHFDAIGPKSYKIRWNNATWGPLHCSGTFKVIDFGRPTNRKPICDFLLVISSSRTVSKLLQINGQMRALNRGYLSLTHSFEVKPWTEDHEI